MTYAQAFENIKKKICSEPNVKIPGEDFAIQITLTNKDCSGIFYIQKSGDSLAVEPYDYYDNNAAISLSYISFTKLIDGRLNPSEAAEKGIIEISGDASIVNSLCGIIPASPKASESKDAPAEKPAAKKPAKKTKSK